MWSPNLYYKLIGDYSFAKAIIPPVEPGVYLAQAAKEMERDYSRSTITMLYRRRVYPLHRFR